MVEEKKVEKASENLNDSHKNSLIQKLAELSKELESKQNDHEKHKENIIQEYNAQIEFTKADIKSRLQKLFDKKVEKLHSEDPSSLSETNLSKEEENLRKQYEIKCAHRLREEKSRLCIEMRSKIEAELKREFMKKMAEAETEFRQKIINEIENEIRTEIEFGKQKSMQKDFQKMNEAYRQQAEEYIRAIKEKEFREQVQKRIENLQKDGATRIDQYSAEMRENVQARLQAHIKELNEKQVLRLQAEEDKLKITGFHELEKSEEKKKLEFTLKQFREYLSKNLREQLIKQLEPSIRQEVTDTINAEIIEKNKAELDKKIATIKRKNKPKLAESIEIMKKKCLENHNAKIKNELQIQEDLIKQRVRGDYENEKKIALNNIEEKYNRKLEDDLQKIEQDYEETKKVHTTLIMHIQKLQNEKKLLTDEFEEKEFDLTKMEIEVKNQLESVEKAKEKSFMQIEKKNKSMIKKSNKRPDSSALSPLKGTSMFLRREPLKETGGFLLNTSQGGKDFNVKSQFVESVSRILPNPDELVDKAINDIGLDDIIMKVMSNKKAPEPKTSESKKANNEEFLIRSPQDIDEIQDY